MVGRDKGTEGAAVIRKVNLHHPGQPDPRVRILQKANAYRGHIHRPAQVDDGNQILALKALPATVGEVIRAEDTVDEGSRSRGGIAL